MKYQQELQRLLLADLLRIQALKAVRELQHPDGWIGAGLVRDAVWDHLHGYGQQAVAGDVDVVWFDAERCDPALDSQLQHKLHQLSPGFDWSVKNQARMHLRNGDTPYLSTENALRYWPGFEREKVSVFRERVVSKGWVERYPLLELIIPE